MTLGQKLRALRKDANLNLRDLGAKVQADFTYLSKIENDKTDNRPPSADLIKRLAKVLKADENELLTIAHRIPDDAKRALTNKDALRFFRTIKGQEQDPEFWEKLNRLVNKHKGQKK